MPKERFNGLTNEFNLEPTAAEIGAVESDPIVKAVNGIVKSNGTTIGAATATSPITITNGDIAIANAAADGSTKGAAAFNATDFTASSGVISLSGPADPWYTAFMAGIFL